MTQTGSET